MNTLATETIELARKQGYVRGLRTAMNLINLKLSKERHGLRTTRKPSDMDLHAEYEHSIEVLKSVHSEIVTEVGKART